MRANVLNLWIFETLDQSRTFENVLELPGTFGTIKEYQLQPGSSGLRSLQPSLAFFALGPVGPVQLRCLESGKKFLSLC